jgi:hypothetical protein
MVYLNNCSTQLLQNITNEIKFVKLFENVSEDSVSRLRKRIDSISQIDKNVTPMLYNIFLNITNIIKNLNYNIFTKSKTKRIKEKGKKTKTYAKPSFELYNYKKYKTSLYYESLSTPKYGYTWDIYSILDHTLAMNMRIENNIYRVTGSNNVNQVWFPIRGILDNVPDIPQVNTKVKEIQLSVLFIGRSKDKNDVFYTFKLMLTDVFQYCPAMVIQYITEIAYNISYLNYNLTTSSVELFNILVKEVLILSIDSKVRFDKIDFISDTTLISSIFNNLDNDPFNGVLKSTVEKRKKKEIVKIKDNSDNDGNENK